MHFEFEQVFAADPDAVSAAFTDASFYDLLGTLPKLGKPELVSHSVAGDVVDLRVRYRFTGELSSAARAVLDPAKLTWVEHSVHDLAARSVRFDLLPDNYKDRLTCSGSYRFAARGEGTVRHTAAELKVRAPLVGRAVEGALASGLREHLQAEIEVVEQFLSGTRA